MVTGVAAEVGSTANNYQILARLATGGMAEIFLVRGVGTTGVERYCVLKRILRDRANDELFVRMFLDEARLAAQLQHPNIAQVYDIGRLGDSYFFTMEYVHGETVRALLQRARSLRRELPIGAILTVIAGTAAGLHHAHQRLGHDGRPLGIVHRDVSPSNLMVSYEGGVKVVDFGVAKAENRAQETRSGTVKGKIAYLSPEQCRGGTTIDRRSDLFSLGIVFWEMLTTERLYKRASDFENMTAIVSEPPAPPSSRRKSVPPELDQISLRLLAKDPNDRYQSGDELVEALEDVATKLGAMVSSSGLARFVREMFGQRPEPWLELDAAREDSCEGITVTSAPIPNELAVGHSLDLVPAYTSQVLNLISSQIRTAPAMPSRSDARHELPLAAPAPSEVGRLPSGSSSLAFPVIGSTGTEPRSRRAARIWQVIAIGAIATIIGSLGVFAIRSGESGDDELAVGPTAVPPTASLATAAVAVAADAQVIATPPIVAAPPRNERRAAMDDKRYADVVARCATEGTADDAEICTVAACQIKNVARARTWHAAIASAPMRRAVAATCRDLGVAVAIAPPKVTGKVVAKPTPKPAAGSAATTAADPCVVNPPSCR